MLLIFGRLMAKQAKGIPCVFEQYEVLRDGHWEQVNNGVPSDKDVIRF